MTQRYLLAAVAASRSNGMLQTDACKATGVAPNNFFYQVQRLEQRDLLTRHQVYSRSKKADGGGGSTATYAMVTPHYDAAFTAAAQQASLRGGTGASASQADGNQSSRLASAEGDAVVCASVCDHLATCPAQSCVLLTLKKTLGLAAHDQKRLWRRIRKRLIEAGCVSIRRQSGAEVAGGGESDDEDDGPDAEDGPSDKQPALRKDTPLITLVKPWPSSSNAANDQQIVAVPAPPPLPTPTLLADVPMESQLLRALLDAGPAGIPQSNLLASVGVSFAEREPWARIGSRLEPGGVISVSRSHNGRAPVKIMHLTPGLALPIEYRPGAVADDLVRGTALPDQGAPGAGAIVVAGAAGGPMSTALATAHPAGIVTAAGRLNNDAHRRKIIQEALAARGGMVLRSVAQQLVQDSLPPGAPKVDRKTVENTANAMAEEGLIRLWTVAVPFARDASKLRDHIVLLRPLQPGEPPEAGKDEQAARAAIDEYVEGTKHKMKASMKATLEAAAKSAPAVQSKAAPLAITAKPAARVGDDEEEEDEEAPAGQQQHAQLEMLPQTQRSRCRRRLGVLRAKCTLTQNLHVWLRAAKPDGAAAFTLEEIAPDMPVHLALAFLRFNADSRAEHDTWDGPATAAATDAPDDDSASFSEAFCVRMETAAAVDGDAGLVKSLSDSERALLLNRRTRGAMCESMDLLLRLELLRAEAAAGEDNDEEAEADEERAAPSSVVWGAHTRLMLATSAVIDAPVQATGPVTAITEWRSETLPLVTASDATAYWTRLRSIIALVGTHRGYEDIVAVHAPACKLSNPRRFAGKEAWKVPTGAGALTPAQRAALFAHARTTCWPRWRVTTHNDDVAEDTTTLAASSAHVRALAHTLGVTPDIAARLLREERTLFRRECAASVRGGPVTAGDALTALVKSGGADLGGGGVGATKKRKAPTNRVPRVAAAAEPAAKAKPGGKRRRAEVEVATVMTADQVRLLAAAAARAAVPGSAAAHNRAFGGADQEQQNGGAAAAAAGQAGAPHGGTALHAPVRFGSHKPVPGSAAAAPQQKGARGAAAGAPYLYNSSGSSSDEDEDDDEEGAIMPLRKQTAAAAAAAATQPATQPASQQPRVARGKAGGEKTPGGTVAGQHPGAGAPPVDAAHVPSLGPLSAAVRCAMELLKLHLMHAVAAPASPDATQQPPPSARPWDGLCGPAAAFDLRASLEAASPGREAIAGGLRALGEAAVGEALTRLRACGHVTGVSHPGGVALTRAFWDAAAGVPGLAHGVSNDAEQLASRLGGHGTDDVTLLSGAGGPRHVIQPGDAVAALTAMATGAARLVLAPPGDDAAGGLEALALPQEAPPAPEVLYRALRLHLARAPLDDEADDTAQEGGGESGFPHHHGPPPAPTTGDADPAPPAGVGHKRRRGDKPDDEEQQPAQRKATPAAKQMLATAQGVEPGPSTAVQQQRQSRDLDACCAAWRTSHGGNDSGVRAAWQALDEAGPRGVSAPLQGASSAYNDAHLAFLASPACGACVTVPASDVGEPASQRGSIDSGAVYVRISDASPYMLPSPQTGAPSHPAQIVAAVLHDLAAARACALVMRLPGAPEQRLTQLLSALAPSQAAALLRALAAAGTLLARTVRTAAPSSIEGVRPRALGGHLAGLQDMEVTHYFPTPAAVLCV